MNKGGDTVYKTKQGHPLAGALVPYSSMLPVLFYKRVRLISHVANQSCFSAHNSNNGNSKGDKYTYTYH